MQYIAGGELFTYLRQSTKLPEEHANVVYHIKCTKCDADYIGKTKRILVHRLKEHDKGETSACQRHLHEHPGHHMDFNNVQIIDQASNDMKLKIKELMRIIQRKPCLKNS